MQDLQSSTSNTWAVEILQSSSSNTWAVEILPTHPGWAAKRDVAVVGTTLLRDLVSAKVGDTLCATIYVAPRQIHWHIHRQRSEIAKELPSSILCGRNLLGCTMAVNIDCWHRSRIRGMLGTCNTTVLVLGDPALRRKTSCVGCKIVVGRIGLLHIGRFRGFRAHIFDTSPAMRRKTSWLSCENVVGRIGLHHVGRFRGFRAHRFDNKVVVVVTHNNDNRGDNCWYLVEFMASLYSATTQSQDCSLLIAQQSTSGVPRGCQNSIDVRHTSTIDRTCNDINQ